MKILVTCDAGFIGLKLVCLGFNNTNHNVLNFYKFTYTGHLEKIKKVLIIYLNIGRKEFHV